MPRRHKYHSEPLIGVELLEKFHTLGGSSREEKARRCGYSYQNSDGSERINMNAFMNALLEAKGIQVDRKKGKQEHSFKFEKRKASYRLSVTPSGCIYISRFYTEQLKLSHGDQLEVFIKRKSILLKKTAPNKNRARKTS